MIQHIPAVTKAFELVKLGKIPEAVKLLGTILADPEHQVTLIQGFISINQKMKEEDHGRPKQQYRSYGKVSRQYNRPSIRR
jgi:hypothetical protein